MNRRTLFTTAANFLKRALILKEVALTIIFVVLILLATLYPFKLSLPNHFSLQAFFESFDNTSTFQDMANNILLFIPLGFGLALLLQKKRMQLIGNLLIVVIFSAGLSSVVEAIQVFLPSRTPTPDDIFNNTVGGFVGAVCFHIYSSQSLKYVENIGTHSSKRKIAIFFIGYILLSFLLAINWLGTSSLSNWSLNYPLMLGNEQTGGRPWHGYISEVHVADRAISKNEIAQLMNHQKISDIMGGNLVASYPLMGDDHYREQTGQLPPLLPQGVLPKSSEGQGIALNASHWLKTMVPVTSLNEMIRKTSQFTIVTNVASADLAQTGPARIISLSNDAFHRNFTLGQQGENLDLRLRTPMTGANGNELKLSIPNIWVDTNSHQIIITYAQANLRVYIDTLENVYSLNLWELVPREQQKFYYGQLFISLGFCLFFLTIFAKSRPNIERLLLASGILLPSLIMEGVLVEYSGKRISLQNLLLGILLTAGTVLALRLLLKVRRGRKLH